MHPHSPESIPSSVRAMSSRLGGAVSRGGRAQSSTRSSLTTRAACLPPTRAARRALTAVCSVGGLQFVIGLSPTSAEPRSSRLTRSLHDSVFFPFSSFLFLS